MIARAYITEWQARVPWPDPVQVEQDLILSRFIVEIANDPLLGEEFTFRGGTALHKLHLNEPLRYSEDLDYVRTSDTPIGELVNALRRIGEGVGLTLSKHSRSWDALKVFFTAEATLGTGETRIRVKIETNQVEMTPFVARIRRPFRVDSRWWSGEAQVLTFRLEELMGTKLRALYQRSKGRDLFDLWHVIDEQPVEDELIVDALNHYMGNKVFSYPQLRLNLLDKLADPDFVSDLDQLVIERPTRYDVIAASDLVMERLGARLRNAPPLEEIASGAWRPE